MNKRTIADTHFEYMYTYKYPSEKVPEGGYEAVAESMKKKFSQYNFDVTILGIHEDNPFFDIDKLPKSKNEVVVGDTFASKYQLKVGDEFTLTSEDGDRAYAFTVYDITNYSASLTVFMDIDECRELFGEMDDYYNGLLKDRSELDTMAVEHRWQTLVNDHARSQESQLAALRREQVLAIAGQSIKDKMNAIEEKTRAFVQEVGRRSHAIGNHVKFGLKMSDLNFTPWRDAVESLHKKAAQIELKHLQKQHKRIHNIEEKALNKFNREASREFKRNQVLERLAGREVKGEYQEVKEFSPEMLDKLNKFQRWNLDRLVGQELKTQERFGHAVQKLDQDKQWRQEQMEPVKKQLREALDRNEILERDMDRFADDLEKAGFVLGDDLKEQIQKAVDDGILTKDKMNELSDKLKGMGIGMKDKEEIEKDDHDGLELA